MRKPVEYSATAGGTGIRSRNFSRLNSLRRCDSVRALLTSTSVRASALLTPIGKTEDESAPPAMPTLMLPAMMLSATLAIAWKLVAQARDTL